MKRLHILYFVLVLAFIAVLYNFLYPVEAVPPCPHPNFVTNHLCSFCQTLEDAADFSKYRPRISRRNTVFFGSPTFEVKTYMKDRCGNIDGTRAAVCTYDYSVKSGNPFKCTWLGSMCYGEHSLTTGHLFYNAIKC